MLPSLYIGRFQPPHNGHFDAIEQTFEGNENIIIGIGSSNESGTERNPYTAEFRERLIRAALVEIPKYRGRYQIVHVPDINDYPAWTAHVERMVLETTGANFGSVYTAAPLTKELFEKYSPAHPVVDLKTNIAVCATEVRARMKNGGDWESLVPPAVARILKTKMAS